MGRLGSVFPNLRSTYWGLFLSLVLLVFAGLVSYLTMRRVSHFSDERVALKTSIMALDDAIFHLKDADRSYLAFRSIHSNEFLLPLERSIQAARDKIDKMGGKIPSDLRVKLHLILARLDREAEEIRAALAARPASDPSVAQTFDESERVAAELRSTLDDRLKAKVEAMDRAFSHTQKAILFSVILASLLALSALRDLMVHFRRQQETEQMLKDAHRTALEAAEMKSAFLANMSHELRTPMNGVIGMTSLLVGTPLNSEQREYLDTIRTSGQSLLRIINDLLDYSKIEAGRVELEEIEFSLRGVIEEVVELFSPNGGSKNLLMTNIIDSSVPSQSVGDPTRIRQILSNLVSNAVKFTENGGVVIRATCVSVRGKPETHISVEDSGIGMTPAQLDRLFRPFSQADSSTTRRFGGSGLGLSISKGLAERMGGRIEVVSTPQVGSRFTFCVPLTSLSVEPPPRTDLSWAQVAIVTNRPLFAQTVQEQLGLRGVSVIKPVSPSDFTLPRPKEEWVLVDSASVPEGWENLWLRDCTRGIVFTSSSKSRNLKLATGVACLRMPWKQSELNSVFAQTRQPESIGISSESAAGHTDRSIAADAPLVLVAEDNSINQRVIEGMLGKLGYRVDVVSDGFEAVEAAKRVAYDAVLMDCHMPRLDGLEATRSIRKLAPYTETPIIALTADALVQNEEKCLAAGMSGYLRKPLEIETLMKWFPDRNGDDVLCVQTRSRLERLPAKQGPSLFIELANLYLDFAPSVLGELQQAAAIQEWGKVRKLAHKLKGASSQIGLVRLSRACEEIEVLEHEALAPKLIHQLNEELSAAREKLAEIAQS